MSAKTTRKSVKRAQSRPDSMPIVEETPLGFFEKFYGPHGNPKWKQLDARGLAQIIIDADRRRAEFQKRMAVNSPPPFNPPKARATQSSLPPELFADAPHDKSALGGLDVLRKNPYADVIVSGLAASRRPTVNGAASKGGPGLKSSAHAPGNAEDAERSARKAENIGSVSGNSSSLEDALGRLKRRMKNRAYLLSQSILMQGYFAVNKIMKQRDAINSAAKKYNINPNIIRAIIYEEQSHQFPPDEDFYGGSTIGLGQFTKKTWEKFGTGYPEDTNDPEKMIDAMANYISFLQTKYGNDVSQIGTGYNYYEPGKPTPNSSKEYGKRIKSFYDKFEKNYPSEVY